MSKMRINLMDWRPDAADFGNQGLTVADNVYHQVDGYRGIKHQSAVSVQDTGIISALSVQVRNAGAADNQVAAWVTKINASTAALVVGAPGTGAFSGTSAATMTGLVATATNPKAAVSAFQACELADKIVITAEAEGMTSTTASTVVSITGYITY